MDGSVCDISQPGLHTGFFFFFFFFFLGGGGGGGGGRGIMVSIILKGQTSSKGC